MEYNNPYDSQEFSEQILQERLNLGYETPSYKPSPPISIEQRVKERLDQEQLIKDQVKIELEARLAQPKPIKKVPDRNTGIDVEDDKEGFSSKSCKSCKMNPLLPGLFDDNRVLLMLIFILVIFCVMQYFTQQQMSDDMQHMMQMIQMMHVNPSQSLNTITSIPNPAVIHPASVS